MTVIKKLAKNWNGIVGNGNSNGYCRGEKTKPLSFSWMNPAPEVA